MSVDLASLRIEEDVAPPRRPLGPRIFGGIVLLLVLGVGLTFAWPFLRPARIVRTVAVRVAKDAPATAMAAATTEAVGWVEADPFPVIVRPLVSGHVETLDVLEGAIVKRDQTIIGTMVSADLQANVDRARATLAMREAARAEAEAQARLATDRLAQNATARTQLLQAKAKLANLQTRLDAAREAVLRTRATARSAAATLVAQERLAKSGSSYPVALEKARATAQAASAEVEHEAKIAAGLAREVDAQQQLVTLCEELARAPVDLQGASAVRTAAVAAAKAAVTKARTDLTIAERELGWATVKAPIDGVVLRLEATPGDMVGHGAKGLVALYDPKKLRARIDVPLDSLGGIHDGQKVEIRSEAIGNRVVHGVVQRLQHETDMLKNTLQVKIGLIDPPPLLRPETLCRARFLATKTDDPKATTIQTVFLVPQSAVRDGKVFVFDPEARTARAVSVEVTGKAGNDAVLRGDLSPTQRVILDDVRAGETIQEKRP